MTTDLEQQESSLDDQLAASLAEGEVSSEEEEVEETVEPTEEEAQEAIEALQPAPKWDKRYKEVFNGWAEAGEDGSPLYPNGRDWQQAMLDLYKESQGYATKVEQERAEKAKEAERLQGYFNEFGQAISPYRDFFASTGAHPNQLIPQGLGLLQDLRNDPQATIMRLARERGIDLQSALSEQPWESPESKQVAELKRELDEWKHNAAEQQRRQAEAALNREREKNARQLQAFTEATDESGNPKHPHLEAVKDIMARLIYGHNQMRQHSPEVGPVDLEAVYEEACKLSPDVAQAIESEREAARLAKANAEAKKASDAAKRVKSGSAGKSKPKLSLDEQIEAAVSNQAA